MTNTATVGPAKVISLHYTLKNDGGDVLDTSGGREPLIYLHGADNIVPGLEQALAGRVVGDHVEVEVPPEEGYGVRQELATKRVERNAFPSNTPLEAGMQFGVQGPNGRPIPVWIKEVVDEHIVLDFNHPLAGQTLHFDVTVAEIRNATKDELDQGHPQVSCCSNASCTENT